MSEHFIPATESDSKYDSLESMGVHDLLTNINQEDQTVPLAVERSIPQIEALVAGILPRMAAGGRLFYIGAGTSGRLGVVDASECPPTFGVAQGVVVGIIAGGDQAIRKAVEFAEDDMNQGWQDLQQLEISENDSLIGIAASGRTPYVLGAIHEAKQSGILTGCISCAPGSPLENRCSATSHSSSRARVRHRQYTDESRNRTKARSQHDLNHPDDQARTSQRQQNDRHAACQQ